MGNTFTKCGGERYVVKQQHVVRTPCAVLTPTDQVRGTATRSALCKTLKVAAP